MIDDNTRELIALAFACEAVAKSRGLGLVAVLHERLRERHPEIELGEGREYLERELRKARRRKPKREGGR